MFSKPKDVKLDEIILKMHYKAYRKRREPPNVMDLLEKKGLPLSSNDLQEALKRLYEKDYLDITKNGDSEWYLLASIPKYERKLNPVRTLPEDVNRLEAAIRFYRITDTGICLVEKGRSWRNKLRRLRTFSLEIFWKSLKGLLSRAALALLPILIFREKILSLVEQLADSFPIWFQS